ncbi:MAG: acyl-ACP--UDP-N-acetylglucosamine O-acyltransferase [Candidatus Rokuibacteriota bacterium]
MIHPTAVIDPGAELAPDARVGPYSVIGPEVTVAAGAEIGAHVVLEGRVRVGARCRVGHGAIIGGVPQDLKFRESTPTGVSLGDDTVVREYVTIHRATQEGRDTIVGRHCVVMASSHIAHDCVLGDHIIVINCAGLTGHVTVEDHATIGGLTGIHPFSRIGTYAYVGGCSKVTQDVPPFVIVDGAPAVARSVNVVGMRRGGIDADSRRHVQAAFRLLYRSGMAPGSAAKRVRAELGDHPLVARLVEFVEASKRGVVPGATRAGRDYAEAQPEGIS